MLALSPTVLCMAENLLGITSLQRETNVCEGKEDGSFKAFA